MDNGKVSISLATGRAVVEVPSEKCMDAVCLFFVC